MSHTINASKFEQTIIHQHVHLRRKSQFHAPAYVLMRLYQFINRSFVYKAKEGRHVRMKVIPEAPRVHYHVLFKMCVLYR